MDARGHPAPPPGLERFAARAMALLIGGVAPGAPSTEDGLRLIRLAGDGSTRQIFRVSHAGVRAVAVANPLPGDRTHPDENEGFLAVREYLHQRKVRVPAFYAADLERGFLLLEDLGDTRLCDLLARPERDAAAGAEARTEGGGKEAALPEFSPATRAHYDEAIDFLVLMQAPTSPLFRPSMVSNPTYTAAFAVAFEARYFHEELVHGLLQIAHDFTLIAEECTLLAECATRGSDPSVRTFMHRDYQSRNLMIAGASVAVIDFQGARHGPPEYDLAALVYDPYARLARAERTRLIERYIRLAAAAGVPGIPSDAAAPRRRIRSGGWEAVFLANAANRLLQALGAYAKLGGRLGHPGFLEHIDAALLDLEAVLEKAGDCPRLSRLIPILREGWRQHPRHVAPSWL